MTGNYEQYLKLREEMEIREQAMSLVKKFSSFSHYHNEDPLLTEKEVSLKNAKECARISVIEIVNLGFLSQGKDHERLAKSQIYYWNEVMGEIDKIEKL